MATDVNAATSALLGLPTRDARRVLSARLALSKEAGDLAGVSWELLQGLKASAATRKHVSRGRVEGRVDWRATQVARTRSALDPTLFVTSPSMRVYDHRRARLLKYALNSLQEHIRAADVTLDDPAITDPWWQDDVVVSGASTVGEVVAKRRLAVQRGLDHAKLGGVRLVDVPPDLGASYDSSGYALAGWDSVEAFVELAASVDGATDPSAVAELVSRVLWAPSSDPALFEWVVGFRIVAAYRELGYAPTHVTALRGTAAPFAHLTGPRGSVMIHRQSPIAQPSNYQRIRRAHGLTGSRLRPDFRIRQSWDQTDVLVEAKHTAGGGQSPLSGALAECLAYIYDVYPYFRDAPWPVALAVSSDQIGLAPARDEVVLTGPAGISKAVEFFADRQKQTTT